MSDYPIREHRPNPTPPPREFMRRCERCSADFLALAAGLTGERGIWRDGGWLCSRECADG